LETSKPPHKSRRHTRNNKYSRLRRGREGLRCVAKESRRRIGFVEQERID
jgi:hypothetical protein